ncbi:MAG: hypothetical protein HYS78_02560 [Parcubacteria group bacterium]|nr:hypothetical protein [Parcubacteria group bacterium]
MRTLRNLFWFLLAFAVVALALPAFGAERTADEVVVPVLSQAEERSYVGMGFYLSSGLSVPAPMAEEILFKLYIDGKPEVREGADLVPQVIEIRRYIPDRPYQEMPLLRLMWDADRDGLADYVAVVLFEDENGPEFAVFPVHPDRKPRMYDQWHFRVTTSKATTG